MNLRFFPSSILLITLLAGSLHIDSSASPALSTETSKNPAKTLTQDWDHFLKSWVDSKGQIDYTALKQTPETLLEIYDLVATYSPESHPNLFPTKEAKLAYWINAYNIATIRAVIKHYPLTSVLEVKPFSFYSLFEGGGFFASQKLKFGGRKYSLYHLENKIIRKRFPDPRIHFALNCASLGCPVLPSEAFTADKLEAQLEHETSLFINDPSKVSVDIAEKKIRLSSIFDWYHKDFTLWVNKTDLLDYIQPYLNQEKQKTLRNARAKGYQLDYIPYDWGLNDRSL